MRSTTDKIAVVGIAGKYPGSDNIQEYWENLVKGKETITTFSDEVLSKFEFNYNELKQNPNYVKARGILNDVDKFDATFFGMTPKEASFTDPQHRVWLETAWNAFENAGIDPLTYKGAIGVYAGGYINTYLHNNILRDPEKLENFIRLRSADSFQIMTGNDVAFIPTKTAYKFNLRGPAVNVQTACSTSLVAIIQACQSLFSFESDVCLAGGVCVMTPQETGYIYQEGAIPSPDGHCRPFDINAKGTVFSNGVGAVILKRLEDALTDRDRIFAVVSGWALNNDGNKKVSFMAPSVDGQAEAITMAQSFADITADEVGYIEAHGTGTHLGDPIEIAALTKAFARNTNKKQYCGIGSVKSNIGHTDAAAGVASFIKSCLSAYYKVIPPSINFSEPNPHIDFANTPFYVQSQLKEWREEKPLVIGVSSFGIGGTNAHLIVEEPPKPEILGPIKQNWPNLFVVSAKTEGALAARKENLTSFLKNENNNNIANIAYTLQYGRQHMSLRSFAVAKELSDITEQKSLFVDGKVDEMQKSTCFVFPGQGAQYFNMGHDLYENSTTFRNILNEAFDIFKNVTGEDLKQIIFSETDKEQLNQTKYTQPSLFIIEYAVARLLIELGIKPDTLIGHSIGEYPAACIAGVFDLETALKIVIKRGQLMQSMPSGKMLAVRSALDTLKNLNSPLFEIAAENSNSACTISLKHEDLEKVTNLLSENKIEFLPLNTSHAFHSSAFDPILDEFSSFINQFNLNRPQIPFISCLTGDFIKDSEAVTGSYWAKQLRHTVLFNNGVSSIAARGNTVYIETGPNTHLSSFIRTNKLVTNKAGVVSTLGKPDNITDTYKVIATLGNLWNVGYDIDFSNIYKYDNSYKTTLPDYPFEKKRYWIEYSPVANPVSVIATKEEKKPVKKETGTVAFDNNSRASLISNEIKRILSELSGNDINDIDSNVSFQDMGYDSLFLAQFARSIESNFKVQILFRQLASEFTTINKLSEHINSKAINKSAIAEKEGITNLMYLNRSGSKTPFILIHGGNSANFLPKYFNNERPILNFFDLGSDGEKIKFKNIDEMAQDYVNQVTTLIPKGPYIFCGFSFGGLLAHKMAQILQSRNEQVPYIIMFDCKTPQAKEPNKMYKTLYLVKGNRLVFLMGALKRKIKKINFYKIYLLAGKVLPTKYRSKYIFSVYLKLAKTYFPTKINSDLLIFRSQENLTYDKNLGWDGLVNKIDLCEIKGDHLNILYIEDNQNVIHSNIQAFIDKHKEI
jgi:acyl transferase domain-containing protein/thioesterase domain-containing protein